MKEKTATNMNKLDIRMKEELSKEMKSSDKEKRPRNIKSWLVEGKNFNKMTIGFLETDGFVSFVNAVDAIIKAANISIVGYEKLGNGIIAVSITGDIGSVRVAIDAGIDAASKSRSHHVRGAVMPNANPGLIRLMLSCNTL
jgi:ethanolamine utilization protein EutM